MHFSLHICWPDSTDGRSFSALRRLKFITLSTMSEQEREGMTLTLVHFREALQLDIWTHDTLLEIVKKRKLRWFGHVVRVKGTLANTILQGKYEGGEDQEEGQQYGGWMMQRNGQG